MAALFSVVSWILFFHSQRAAKLLQPAVQETGNGRG